MSEDFKITKHSRSSLLFCGTPYQIITNKRSFKLDKKNDIIKHPKMYNEPCQVFEMLGV